MAQDRGLPAPAVTLSTERVEALLAITEIGGVSALLDPGLVYMKAKPPVVAPNGAIIRHGTDDCFKYRCYCAPCIAWAREIVAQGAQDYVDLIALYASVLHGEGDDMAGGATLKMERERAKVSIRDVLDELLVLFPKEPLITERTLGAYESKFGVGDRKPINGTKLHGAEVRRAINSAERKRLTALQNPQPVTHANPLTVAAPKQREPAAVIPEELRAPTVWDRMSEQGIASPDEFAHMWNDKSLSYPELLHLTGLTDYDLSTAAQELKLSDVKPFDSTAGLTPAQRGNVSYQRATARARTTAQRVLRQYGIDRNKLLRIYDTHSHIEAERGLGVPQQVFYTMLGLLDIPLHGPGYRSMTEMPEPFPVGTPGGKPATTATVAAALPVESTVVAYPEQEPEPEKPAGLTITHIDDKPAPKAAYVTIQPGQAPVTHMSQDTSLDGAIATLREQEDALQAELAELEQQLATLNMQVGDRANRLRRVRAALVSLAEV